MSDSSKELQEINEAVCEALGISTKDTESTQESVELLIERFFRFGEALGFKRT